MAKANEFASAIRETDEYKAYASALKAFQGDLPAKRLIATFQSRQRRLQLGRFEPTLMDELKLLNEQISGNMVIQSLGAAEWDLVMLLEETDDLISQRIGRKFTKSAGGCCCG